MTNTQLIHRARRSFSRLSRFFIQLMRENLSCGPVTLQQSYALEALADGPKSMNELAAIVALHQSTLTRIVEKLEKKEYVRRVRKPGNQRTVEVQLTESGKNLFKSLDCECSHLTAKLFDAIPEKKRETVVESMEILADLLNPENESFQKLLAECCSVRPAD